MVENLISKTITDFSRRGKLLISSFDNRAKLYIHPRMVGQLITCPKEMPKIKHTHFIMKFDND